jgi:anti-sigma factor RsiW
MDCGEFLRGLSDVRDGLVRDTGTSARFEAHRATCPRCAKLMTALDMGLQTLREPEDPRPSDDFRLELDRRLRAEVAIGDPVMPTHAGLAAAFLIVAALGLVLYQGVGRRGPAATANQPPAGRSFPERPRPLPPMQDVTLPPFANSSVEYHGSQPPLGTFAGLGN